MTSSSPVQLIRPPELSERAPYAYAAVTQDVSRLIFTADAGPLDASGEIVRVGDVAGQAEQVMANLTVALRAAGAGLTDVVKTTVYVASQRQEDLRAASSTSRLVSTSSTRRPGMVVMRSRQARPTAPRGRPRLHPAKQLADHIPS